MRPEEGEKQFFFRETDDGGAFIFREKGLGLGKRKTAAQDGLYYRLYPIQGRKSVLFSEK